MQIAEADNTAQYWPNLGSQQSAIVIGPVSPFESVKCWADVGGLCRIFKLTELQPKLGRLSLLLWHPLSKVEEQESPWTPHYWAMCHFHHGKPFWKWENQSSPQHRPVTVPKINDGDQSLGQNLLPSAYRSYYSRNNTILATDLWKIFGNAGPALGRI